MADYYVHVYILVLMNLAVLNGKVLIWLDNRVNFYQLAQNVWVCVHRLFLVIEVELSGRTINRHKIIFANHTYGLLSAL